MNTLSPRQSPLNDLRELAAVERAELSTTFNLQSAKILMLAHEQYPHKLFDVTSPLAIKMNEVFNKYNGLLEDLRNNYADRVNSEEYTAANQELITLRSTIKTAAIFLNGLEILPLINPTDPSLYDMRLAIQCVRTLTIEVSLTGEAPNPRPN